MFQLDTNIGRIALHWLPETGKLLRIDWSPDEYPAPLQQEFTFLPPTLDGIITSLNEYFTYGKPLGKPDWECFDQSGWSEFQHTVYRAAVEIPHGETRTYSWIAARVGKYGANRAVGQALRRNPIPILIPCHRVTSTLSLGGFMGCVDPNDPEMKLKQQLLRIEEEYLNPLFPFLSGRPGHGEHNDRVIV
jgi:methylated-DNA-[protein]-cysteine S-methyltransferase